MKNTLKVLGIIALLAVIGFSMVACDNGSTSSNSQEGYITITDIPSEYNGMNLHFMIDPRSDGSMIESVSENGVVITNNKFAAPLVRKPNRLGSVREPYTGSETIVAGSEKFFIQGYEYWLSIRVVILPVGFTGSWPDSAYSYFKTVTFKKGGATLSFKDRITK